MLFSSIPFLYYFLPCVLILYHIVPKKCRNGALLLVSLVFYAWGEPKFVFLMMGMVLLNYLAGILIGRYGQEKKGKAVLWGALTVSIGVLCFYKFSDVAWPIGISFYTFQLISYLADVYRGTAAAQKNLVNLGAYVTMFPQLIAGPIVRYVDIEKQLKVRIHSYEKTLAGIERFVIGLGKKILISNALGELCEIFKTSDEKSVLFFWVYAIGYTLQIYFDFSGYSDMAIGLGKIFGFDFLENFDYPYISCSVTEFWRRWHMSLGTFFRDYVYIPLGGNRVGKARWLFNTLVVWMLTGFWHGAAWNFILWGLLIFILQIIEKNLLLTFLRKENFIAKLLSHAYMTLYILISWTIFAISDFSQLRIYLARMFPFFGIGNSLNSLDFVKYITTYAPLLLICLFFCTEYPKKLAEKLEQKLLNTGISLAIFWYAIYYLSIGLNNPFLYFRF